MSDAPVPDLRCRLEDLLAEAANDLRRHERLRREFPLGPSAIEGCVSRALDGLSESLRASSLSRCPSDPIADRSEAPRDRVVRGGAGRAIDTAVIVPLGNPSQQLQRRCLLSVARNFDPQRTIVVLYTREGSESQSHCLPGFDVVELQSPGRFSLPTAYTHCIGFLSDEMPEAFQRLLLVFMDDDAAISGHQEEALNRQMLRVRSGNCVLASGHYYDETPVSDVFSAAIECSGSPEFVAGLLKPYCHGGAAMMLSAARFPQNGLPEAGLGGISIGVLLIDQLESAWQERLAQGDWYIVNDPKLTVLHPRKRDLLQWTATYSGYAKAWKAALDLLSERSRSIWESRLESGRQRRFEALVASIDSAERGVAVVANLLLTRFFKPKLSTRFSYDEFQHLGLHVHSNLR